MNHQFSDIPDAQARKDAIDTSRSFIVQAPAGSGKTELLIQRFLALLSNVNSPEQIVAITFTRKAAAEMKERVVDALVSAVSGDPPDAPHKKITWELARSAGMQDELKGWNIRRNPARLYIGTIDALCAAVTRQMPVLSGFGVLPQVVDDAPMLYRKAAANTVMELESAADWSDSVEALIRHMDNNIGKVESLIAEMLPRRDQWLRHVVNTKDVRLQRKSLENVMGAVIESGLRRARRLMPEIVAHRLPELARFAARNLFSQSPASPVCACLEMKDIPECIPEELETWKGIATLLLVQNGGFRKSVDKRTGFPAGPGRFAGENISKSEFQNKKSAFKELLAQISGHTDFAAALDAVRHLPAPYYTDEQWDLIEALFEILKLSVAHLQLVFQKHGGTDFTEIAMKAATALGDAENPTDLALVLDYGISHILVDEFQDTSISQFELLSRLTAGWSPGDGKTFFAVGDPMQSIYSFREAEVGLFLKAREYGMGAHLPLEKLLLTANFRSDKSIVDWINDTFAGIFPEKSDPATGAVAYSRSSSVRGPGNCPAVNVHLVIDPNGDTTEKKVIECITSAQSENPEGNIAVLVRSRSHLGKLPAMLRDENLRYKAVDIDPLGKRPVISDLTAIARAFSRPADRVAWLALLRAPWCGLELADLYVLAGKDHASTVYDLICDPDRSAKLSEDGRARLFRLLPALHKAMEMRGRKPLRRLVETFWTAIGGPACINEADLQDASVFFDFLDKTIGHGPINDYPAFENGVMQLFSAPDPQAGGRLQIMTIHKAKGLQFDTVIICGLEKAPRTDTEKLLLWQETAVDDFDRKGFLLAPIAETGAAQDPTYKYIKRLQAEKNDHEARRLLYVAATRARVRLDLIGSLKIRNFDTKAKDTPSFHSRSLLHCLWPAVENHFHAALKKSASEDRIAINDSDAAHFGNDYPRIRRLTSRWEAPTPFKDTHRPESFASAPLVTEPKDFPRFDWAGTTARMTGTVIHKWLRIICETGANNWNPAQVEAVYGKIKSDLANEGIDGDQIEDAAGRVSFALLSTLADDTGRWLLLGHREGKCEYRLAGLISGKTVYAVIDRTFVDENSIRWVVDYKSGIHTGAGLDAFMAQERMRYEQQTALYAELMKKKEPGRTVRRALYFPMFSGWCPWPGE